MITFTKEQLIASAHARIEFAEMMLAGELEPLKERTWSIELELARIALASLEAEAVCVIDQSNLDYLKSGSDADVWPASRTEMGDVLLYRAAPPAPVSVPDLKELEAVLNWILMLPCPTPKATYFAKKLAVVIDTCRAAMLQGADGKPELTVWYGSMPESNGKANWTAILHRKGEGRCMDGFTIDRSEYPGRVLYAADRVRYLIGEKSERPSILDYDADAHSGYVKPGNSPVIPDDVRRMDWLVSKTVDVREPMVYGSHSLFWSQTITDEEDDYHATKLREQIDAAMEVEQAAAPQQEVK